MKRAIYFIVCLVVLVGGIALINEVTPRAPGKTETTAEKIIHGTKALDKALEIEKDHKFGMSSEMAKAIGKSVTKEYHDRHGLTHDDLNSTTPTSSEDLTDMLTGIVNEVGRLEESNTNSSESTIDPTAPTE